MSEIKFYMNNPCVIVRDVGEFCEVKINPQFTMGFDGSNFCMACNVGGGQNMPPIDHKCEEAEEIIDAINEESAAIIVMVEKRLMHDYPVEQKEYKDALNNIGKAKATFKVVSDEVFALRGEIRHLNEQIGTNQKKLEMLKLKRAKREDLLEHIDKEIEEKTKEKAQLVSQNMHGNIDLYSLIKDSFILSKLELGGVDNWDFYSDVYPSDDEINNAVKNALEG